MKITTVTLALFLIIKSVLAGYSTGVHKPPDQKPAVEHRPVIYPTDSHYKYPQFPLKPEKDAGIENDDVVQPGPLSDHSSDSVVEWKTGPVPGYPASDFGGISDGSVGGKPDFFPGNIQVSGIGDHGVADKSDSFSDSSADVISDGIIEEKHVPVVGKFNGWIYDAGIESGIKTDSVKEHIPSGGISDAAIADKFKEDFDIDIDYKEHDQINSGSLPSNPSIKEKGIISDADIIPIEDQSHPKDFGIENKKTDVIIETGPFPSILSKDIDDTAVAPIEDTFDSKDYGIQNKETDDVIIDGINPGPFPSNLPKEIIGGTHDISITPDDNIPNSKPLPKIDEINISITDEEPKLNLFDMSNTLQLTRFLHLIDEAGLQDMLTDKEPMTIFAPSDYALSQLDAAEIRKLATDKDFLREYVLYHCVDGSIYGSSMVNNLALNTRADKTIYANKYGETWYINGMPITIKDQRCSNGVINVLDKPLPLVSNGDILQTLETLGNCNIFTELIKNAKLDEEILKDEGPFTIFAPVDSAFSELPASNLEWLKWDIPAIKKMFGQLTVLGTYYTSWIPTVPNSELEPLDKEATLTFSGYPDAITVNNVRLVEKDITADNGCIHVIDDIWFLAELGSVPPSAEKSF